MTETKPVAKNDEAPVQAPKVSKRESNMPRGVSRERSFDVDSWTPVTRLGKLVKAGKITNIDEILDKGETILEAEIVDALLPTLRSDLLSVGQSKVNLAVERRVFGDKLRKKLEKVISLVFQH